VSKPYEEKFERDIELSLIIKNKFVKRTPSDFDPELCLDPDMLLDFIRTTQHEEWKKLKSRHGEDVKEKFLDR
jgi:type I restriction enzyme R subunit